MNDLQLNYSISVDNLNLEITLLSLKHALLSLHYLRKIQLNTGYMLISFKL